MKSAEDVDELERLIVQLAGLHDEISQLAKKAPNDGLNPFKLKLVNKVIEAGNASIPARYRPFADFERFEADDLPTNSDVVVILAQYIQQTERYRSDNVVYDAGWVYIIDGKPSKLAARAPSRVGGERK